MAERALTAADVERVTDQWSAGIGPDDLHTALGWSAAELERYQATGELPPAPLEERLIDSAQTKTYIGMTAGEIAADLIEKAATNESPSDRIAEINAAMNSDAAALSSNPFLTGVVELEPDTAPTTRLHEAAEVARPGPVRSDDAQATQFWMFYTRWRPKPAGDGSWKVLGEHGEQDSDGPRRHDNYELALRRADDLNDAERTKALNLNDERKT